MAPDLVVLGNLPVDDVVLPDGRTRMGEPGGAVLYAGLGATLWGVRTGIVTWRGDEYPAWALEALAARGVDLAGVHDLGGPGLRTWLLYEGARRRVVHRLEGPTHAEVSPKADEIPADWLSARAFHLAPMPLEVQQGLVGALSSREGAFVSVDPYELLRMETLEAWRALVARVDALFLSEDELELAAPDDDPSPVLESLASGRLRYVVWKRGARGGRLYDARERRWHDWTARADKVVDPTGAGDAFAAGLLAGWLCGEPAERALLRGIVGASFAIEEWGPAGLMRATPDEARARLRAGLRA